jgi:tetratricopeptide (TPR) repeat protein
MKGKEMGKRTGKKRIPGTILLCAVLGGCATSQTLIERGLTAYRDGRDEEAMALFEEAVARDPRNPQAFVHRGAVKSHKGNWEEALADENRVVEIDPDFPWGYANRGLSFNVLGRYKDALSDFDKALSLAPENDSSTNLASGKERSFQGWVHSNRGIALFRLKLYDMAADSWVKAWQFGFDERKYLNGAAEALILGGDPAKAIGKADQALDGVKDDDERAVALLLKTCAARMLGRDTAQMEKEYAAAVAKPFATRWNTRPFEEWLESVVLMQEVKAFLREKAAMFAEHPAKNPKGNDFP